ISASGSCPTWTIRRWCGWTASSARRVGKGARNAAAQRRRRSLRAFAHHDLRTRTVGTAPELHHARMAPRGAPLPTLLWGILSQAPGSAGCEGEALAQRRRAEPKGAQGVAVDMRRDWLPEIAAAHCITSYPVGPS